MYIAVAIDDDKSVSTFHGIILPKCLSTSDAGVSADSVRPVQKRGRGVEVWRGGGAAAAGARLWLLNGHRWDGIIAQPFQFPAFNGRSSSLERTHCGRPKPARGPGLRRSDPAQAAAYPNTRAPSIPPFRALGQGPPSCPATRTRTVIKYNQRARSPHAQGPAVPGNPHEMERSDVVSPAEVPGDSHSAPSPAVPRGISPPFINGLRSLDSAPFTTPVARPLTLHARSPTLSSRLVNIKRLKAPLTTIFPSQSTNY